MQTNIILACIGVFFLTHCGDESQVNRTALSDTPSSNGKKSTNAETSIKEKQYSPSSESESPEDKAARLEDEGFTNGGYPLASIVLSQGAGIMPVGAQSFWTATGVYDDDSERQLTDLVTWTTYDAAIIELIQDEPGGITSVSVGSAILSASLGDITSEREIKVIP